MSEENIEMLAAQIADNLRCAPAQCPLGITLGDAKALVKVVKIASWAGMVFAAAVLVSFASGFAWLIWEFLKFAIREAGGSLE